MFNQITSKIFALYNSQIHIILCFIRFLMEKSPGFIIIQNFFIDIPKTSKYACPSDQAREVNYFLIYIVNLLQLKHTHFVVYFKITVFFYTRKRIKGFQNIGEFRRSRIDFLVNIRSFNSFGTNRA